MHDIGRTQLEAEQYAAGLGGPGELEQYESELPLHEGQELEFASRLLEVSNEQELEQFLGDIFRTVGRAAGRFARSDTGRALGGILKDAVGKALPIVGGAVAPAPGADLAQQAGSLLGLELEGLSRQDQEFETARQLVRFAGSAYRRAASAPRNVPPRTAARMAVAGAGRRYAPGLLRRPGRAGDRSGRSGGQRRRDGGRGRLEYRDGARRRDEGFGQGGPGYWRPRGPRPWPPVYRWPAYPWGMVVPPWAAVQEPGASGPNGYGAPAAGDAPPAEEPPASEPAAAGEPPEPSPDAAATPAAEPGSAGELGGYTTPGWRPPAAGMAAPRARSGRWERRGRVLIVYGA